MEFSWIMAIVSFTVVFFEGFASWLEGTFWPGQKNGKVVKLPFVLHGGVIIGDLVLLPYVYGIWVPCLKVLSLWALVALIIASVTITWFCHKAWWFMCENQSGFMYPDRLRSEGDPAYWWRDLPPSAWTHLEYMAGSLLLIGAYIFSPMPAEVVWRTFWIFIIFVPVAVIEPGIVQGWPPTKKDILTSIGIAAVLWTLVGLVTCIKLAHWWIF